MQCDEEMLKLWRLVKRGGALEMDHGVQTEAEEKPGEGSMSPEEGSSEGGCWSGARYPPGEVDKNCGKYIQERKLGYKSRKT